MDLLRPVARLALIGALLLPSLPAQVVHACGYGPRPSIAIDTPKHMSIVQRPFEISGTARGSTCNGVDHPVASVTVRLWPAFGARPIDFVAECTCPGQDVTWNLTLTRTDVGPTYYTVDADAYDTYDQGAKQRINLLVL